MIIGIDIDDTLTDIRDRIKEEATKYAKKLGKNIKEEAEYIEDKNNGNIYQEKYGFTYEELKYFLKEIQENITKNAKPRKGARQAINKLRKKGNKIYIITARDKEFHDDPYMLSKNWLDKNKIEYDKIIVNAREKAKICKQENVDIMIDDKLANCIKISNEGIKVIRITDYKEKHGDIVNKSNWKEIYRYIKEME